jgi:hypothetical protein
MTGPSWLAGALACIMIATSIYCLNRLLISWRRHQPTERDVDAVHVLMGVAMAGMLVPRLQVFWAGGWEVVFGTATAWFAWRAIRGLSRRPDSRQHAHHLQHLIACLAMLYMLLTLTSAGAAATQGVSAAGAMPGGPGRQPTLALAFAVALLGYVIWTADRLTSPATATATVAVAVAGAGAAPTDGGGTGGSRARHHRSGPASAAEYGHRVSGPASAAEPGRFGTSAAPAAQAGPPPLSPRLAACCEIAMGVTMGYMLIMML